MNQVSSNSSADTVRAVGWSDQGLKVLDQRVLPDVVRYDVCATADAVADAIATMRVRGAPAIGVAAAFGVVLAARQRYRDDPSGWKQAIEVDFDVLARSRPTAVNLFWALDLMRREIAELDGDPFPRLLSVAERVHSEDIAANRRMGELGADLLDAADGLLTHCNTGSLATGGYGTALGVVRSACQRRSRQVFATETRPWRQGARLTVWELAGDGIPATLLADSAAPYLMSRGSVQWVIVGADRIAANGDTANKIGTYALAVAAKQHGVKFMVVAPSTTIDTETASGAGIEIEERSAAELLPEVFLAPDSIVGAWNPVFDVTPASLIDAIVTEHGVIHKPSRENLASLTSMLRQQRLGSRR